MAAKYVLYFDSVRHDNERTVRRAVILVIVLAHVMLFWSWGRQHLVAISSLTNSAIFVELHNTLPLRATTVEKRTVSVPRSGPVAIRTSVSPSPRVTAPVSDGPDIADAATQGGSVRQTNVSMTGVPFYPPRVIHRPKSIYPRDAFERHEEGSADVLVSIGADGSLVDAQIQKSTGSRSLDAASLASVHAYTFKNAVRGSEPVSAQAVVEVDWEIMASTKIESVDSSAKSTAVDSMRRALNALTTPCKALQQPIQNASQSLNNQCGPRQ